MFFLIPFFPYSQNYFQKTPLVRKLLKKGKKRNKGNKVIGYVLLF